MDEVFYELGVDISSDFTFTDGDINLARYDDNLVQAIANRLQTDLDELELFYEDYGSIMMSFLGWRGNDETIGFISSELETVLQQDSRILGWEHEITYEGNGVLRIDLKINPNPTYTIEATLNITTEGVEVVESGD